MTKKKINNKIEEDIQDSTSDHEHYFRKKIINKMYKNSQPSQVYVEAFRILIFSNFHKLCFYSILDIMKVNITKIIRPCKMMII